MTQSRIDISDSKDTDKYLDVLRKYNIVLRSTFNKKKERVSMFSKEVKKMDDEEARDFRIVNKQLYELLNGVLGEIENKRKSRKRKLSIPKSIMTHIQKEKEARLKNDGPYGKIEAFMFNVLDARMREFHGISLLPENDFRKSVEPNVRMRVLKHLVSPVLVEKKLPEEINIESIAEKVFKTENIADKELVIRIINDLLE